jgi:riboflavin synthase alpha subunit
MINCPARGTLVRDRAIATHCLQPGQQLNLERAVRLGDRLGGHLVQGHVDAVSRLLAVTAEGDFARWRLELPPALERQVAFVPGEGVTGSHLLLSATIPGIDEATFQRFAEEAKANCPISKALAGVPITLEASLA